MTFYLNISFLVWHFKKNISVPVWHFICIFYFKFDILFVLFWKQTNHLKVLLKLDKMATKTYFLTKSTMHEWLAGFSTILKSTKLLWKKLFYYFWISYFLAYRYGLAISQTKQHSFTEQHNPATTMIIPTTKTNHRHQTPIPSSFSSPSSSPSNPSGPVDLKQIVYEE